MPSTSIRMASSSTENCNALQYLGFRMDDFGAQSVLAAYDDHPDGKLDLVEFARLVADAERGGIYSDPWRRLRPQAAIVPPV